MKYFFCILCSIQFLEIKKIFIGKNEAQQIYNCFPILKAGFFEIRNSIKVEKHPLIDPILILFIRLYKKLDLDANVWSIFVHKTENFEVDTLIECGASCNSKEQQCDMFIFQKEKLKCHVGTFENSNQNYLNGQTGTNPAFLYIGKYIFIHCLC